MVHMCRYRTLAPDTYFCPLCRQLVHRGRMIVVSVLDDEDVAAMKLWVETAQQAIETMVEGLTAWATYQPPSVASLRAFADRIRMECSRPTWEQRLRMGPRWIVRAKRGARYTPSLRRAA